METERKCGLTTPSEAMHSHLVQGQAQWRAMKNETECEVITSVAAFRTCLEGVLECVVHLLCGPYPQHLHACHLF